MISAVGIVQIPLDRSRCAWPRRSSDTRGCHAALVPGSLAWVVIAARPLFVIALRADVNNSIGVVMTCQIAGCVGAS